MGNFTEIAKKSLHDLLFFCYAYTSPIKINKNIQTSGQRHVIRRQNNDHNFILYLAYRINGRA